MSADRVLVVTDLPPGYILFVKDFETLGETKCITLTHNTKM